MRARPTRRCSATGHTLIELVLSLTLLAIVMASVGSAMLFAARASPSPDGPTATLINDSRVMNRIAEDLAQAKYILAYSATSVTLIVDDRTGDGVPDQIRYAWTGNAGDPLTYQLNGGKAVAIIEQAQAFALDFELTPVVTTLPPAVTFGSETLVSSFTTATGTEVEVNSTNYYGQVLTPTLSSGALGFVPTSAQICAEYRSETDGVMNVALRDATGNTPGDTLYGQADIDESLLPSSDAWYPFTLSDTATVPAGQKLSLLCTYVSGTSDVARLRTSGSLGGGLISSTNSGASWSGVLLNSLTYRLYGKEVFQANDGFDLKRNHVTSVTVSLQSVASDRSPVQRSTRLLKAPELLDTFWDVDFNANPSLLDLNDDGTRDWMYGGGGSVPEAALVGGVWNATNSLVPLPRDDISGVIRMDVRMRTSNSKQVIVMGPFTVDSGGQALPINAILKEDGSGGQVLNIYNEAASTTALLTVHVHNMDWIDLHMTVLPDVDTMYLKVNGVEYGSFLLSREADSGLRGVSLIGSGDGAQFAEARVSIGGSYTTAAGDTTLLEGVLNVLGGLLN